MSQTLSCAAVLLCCCAAELLPQKNHGKLDPAPGRFPQFPSLANCLEAWRGGVGVAVLEASTEDSPTHRVKLSQVPILLISLKVVGMYVFVP